MNPSTEVLNVSVRELSSHVVASGSTLVFVLQWWATRRHTGMWTHPTIPSIADIKRLIAREPKP